MVGLQGPQQQVAGTPKLRLHVGAEPGRSPCYAGHHGSWRELTGLSRPSDAPEREDFGASIRSVDYLLFGALVANSTLRTVVRHSVGAQGYHKISRRASNEIRLRRRRPRSLDRGRLQGWYPGPQSSLGVRARERDLAPNVENRFEFEKRKRLSNAGIESVFENENKSRTVKFNSSSTSKINFRTSKLNSSSENEEKSSNVGRKSEFGSENEFSNFGIKSEFESKNYSRAPKFNLRSRNENESEKRELMLLNAADENR